MLTLWIVTAVASGTTAGLMGLYLVGASMPLLAMAIAHVAMAGAVAADLFGLPPLPIAMGVAVMAAIGLGSLATSALRADLGVLTSILLSFSMGLAFLGIGLSRSDSSALLGLLWGSLLFIQPTEVWLLVIAGSLFVSFGAAMRRPLDAFLFVRGKGNLAAGIRSIFVVFMVFAAVLITLQLRFVGGLLLYALLTNPAAAALELASSMQQARLLSVAFAVTAAVGGFFLSWWLQLPTGATIVLASTAIYAIVVVLSRLHRCYASA